MTLLLLSLCKRFSLTALHWPTERISLKAVDSMALLRGEARTAALSPSLRSATTVGKVRVKGHPWLLKSKFPGPISWANDGRISHWLQADSADLSQKMSSSTSGSDDDFFSPSRHSASKSRSSRAYRPPSAQGSPPQSSRTAESTATSDEDAREVDRRRWREFRERRTPYRSAVLQLREKKPKSTSVEPSECRRAASSK